MTKLRDAVDRFCARHPRFGIPRLMLYVVAGNAIVYLLTVLTQANNADALSFLTFNLSGLLRGEVWRIVTFIFFPMDSNPVFLFITLYFYYWIGSSLEREWGTARFNIYYFSGVLLTVIGAILASLITGQYGLTVAGATYVNLSMFLAFAVLFPDMQVLIMFIIPVKIKWLAIIDGVLFAVMVVYSLATANWIGVVLPIMALLNFLVFVWPEVRRLVNIGKRQNSRQAVDFRKAVRAQQRQKGYHHKCAVCGRTDAEYPDLQFRYCSKCAGYHCFCQDHIFSHVHFTE
ncbi:MAG: rhomboid family intramembrane serine protease [Oscillospiraceae bacterium]|nr:rhomboid family intramembrane serine protease [Oscillospiraceae bacterium]